MLTKNYALEASIKKTPVQKSDRSFYALCDPDGNRTHIIGTGILHSIH